MSYLSFVLKLIEILITGVLIRSPLKKFIDYYVSGNIQETLPLPKENCLFKFQEKFQTEQSIRETESEGEISTQGNFYF